MQLSRSLLPKQKRIIYLHDDEDQLTYLGQIMTQLGHNVHKARFPSETGKLVAPFTVLLHGRTLDSEITLQILRSDSWNPIDQEDLLRKLLPTFNLEFTK